MMALASAFRKMLHIVIIKQHFAQTADFRGQFLMAQAILARHHQ